MSVSLALVPVALALRFFMGKKRFDAWIESMQVKIPTTFKDENDLITTVRKSGYDADKWGGSYKTHIKGEEFFFFWELVNNRWTAIFGKSDNREDIKAFIRDLEAKAGRSLFEWEEEGIKPAVIQTRTFPTNFRDSEMLQKTLVDYGLSPAREKNGTLICKVSGMTLQFSQADTQPFSLEVINPLDMQHLYTNINKIDEMYGTNVQKATYDRLTSKIKDHGIIIQNEEIDEADQSMVITLSLN